MIEPRWAIERWSRWVTRHWRCADLAPGSLETVLGFADGSVQWIDAMGQEVWEAGWGTPLTQVRILPNKKKIVVLDEHSRLAFLDFQGNRLKTINFKVYWTSFEVQSKALVLWGWRALPRALNFRGEKLGELGLPKPWRVVRAMAKKDLFFVVHNQVTVGVYDAKGNRRWFVNSPAPIYLSRETPSDIAASDTGNMVAVGCFDKGVYLYNLLARTLRHIDLENRVDHLAVSGDGRWLLLADSVGGIRLVTAEVTVVWEQRLGSKVRFCRLDRKGRRALVLEESGRLSCLEFTDSKRPRAQFLEWEHAACVSPRQAWSRKGPPGPAAEKGQMRISDDGAYLLCGVGKQFLLFESGTPVWSKTLNHTGMGGRISAAGGLVVLANSGEMILLQTQSGREVSLRFPENGLRGVSLDPAGKGVLTLQADGVMVRYNSAGARLWTCRLKQRVRNIWLQTVCKRAVLQGVGRTLYFVNLKTFQVRRLVLDEPVSCAAVRGGALYAGGEKGACWGLDSKGKVRWQRRLAGAVREILPFQNSVVFRTETGSVGWCQDDGALLARVEPRSAASLLLEMNGDLLEVVREDRALACNKLTGDGSLWTQSFPEGVREVAVNGRGDRLGVLSGQKIYCLELAGEPDAENGRLDFLEF